MDDSGKGVSPSNRSGTSHAGHRFSGADDANSESGGDRASQGLSGHTQKRIGLHLRAMYDTIVQQPVPDRFRDLIAKLEASGDQS